MSLRLSDISYTYAPGTAYQQRALSGVELAVEPGELVMVLGATGSGKSTLLRIAAGLLAADGGTATIDDTALSASSARGAVGLVFQDAESQLFADTLADDVAFGPRNLGLDAAAAHAAATEALDRVGLPAQRFGERSPFTLSGGEARRAAIAGVIAMGPRYLLADEPTAGLDAAGRALVREVLLGFREHAGVVIVSHTAEEFLAWADRVIVLADGATSWSGTAAQLLEAPQVLEPAGLHAPDVLRTQQLARECGLDANPFTLDPVAAAAQLLEARGR